MKPVRAEDLVEDVVRDHASSAAFMRGHGIVCVQCGEPVWGTMGEIIKSKGKNVREVLDALNQHLAREGEGRE